MSYQPDETPPTVGAEATNACNDGYILDGISTRTCEAADNGTWTGSVPECIREYSTICKPCSLTSVNMSDPCEMKALLVVKK